jgi:hypothetical protein
LRLALRFGLIPWITHSCSLFCLGCDDKQMLGLSGFRRKIFIANGKKIR